MPPPTVALVAKLFDTPADARAAGYLVQVTSAIKMRQAANRVLVQRMVDDMRGEGCVVVDLKERTLSVYRRPALPPQTHNPQLP